MRARTEIPSAEITAAVTIAGWQVVAIEEGEDWRCRELWHLKSCWSPQHSEAFLFFLVDQQDSSPNRKVDSVSASATRTAPRMLNEADRNILYFGKGWPKKLPGFVSNLRLLSGEKS